MEDIRSSAVAELARHFEYDTAATEAFYDHHASSIPSSEDHASYLLDKVTDWKLKDVAGYAGGSGGVDDFNLDDMSQSIADLNKALSEMNMESDASQFSTAATEGLGSVLKKGANWVKRKATGKSSKSSKTSKKKKEKGGGGGGDDDEDDDTSDAAIERHQRNLDAMKRTLEKSKTKRRNDEYDQSDRAGHHHSSGHHKTMKHTVESPGDSEDEDDGKPTRRGMGTTRGRMAEYAHSTATSSRDAHYDYTMADVDEEALVKDVRRILARKSPSDMGKTKFSMPRESSYDAGGVQEEQDMSTFDDAQREDFSTEETGLKFGPFGSKSPALMLEVMAFDHADVVEDEMSVGRTVETIVPALASSLELWDRRIDKNGNFAMDRYKFVTDFVGAERLMFTVPGYKAPLLQRIGEFNIAGGSVQTSNGGLFSANTSKLSGARVEVYQLTLRPDKTTTGLTNKRMVLMHWPLSKGVPVYNSGFVKEMSIKISDVKSTATQSSMPNFPLEKKTIRARFSASCKRIIEEDPTKSHLLVDGYVDKVAKRAVAILMPYVNKEIKSVNFFWEN